MKAVIKREVMNGHDVWKIEVMFDNEQVVLDRVVVDEIEVCDSFEGLKIRKGEIYADKYNSNY